MLRGFYRFHRFIGSELKKNTQPADYTAWHYLPTPTENSPH